MLCHIVVFIPGAGVKCPFLSSRASWRRRRSPPPVLLGLRASLYRPNQTRDNCNGRLLYPVRAVRCYLVRFSAHRQRCERFLLAAGCSTKELSKTTVSFWLRMPLSRVCRLSVTGRSVCVPWARCTRAVAPFLLWEEPCCHPAGRAWMWPSHTSLRSCYLRAVAHRFLAAFHRSCVVAVQALVLPGPARLDISRLTDWKLALGSCFLVRSPNIHRLPMGCHGWWFVYVSTFWNVVCIISWKYWITLLQNLSFLLKYRLILSLPQLLASTCPGSYGREGGSAGLRLLPPASMAPDPQRLSG